MCFVGLLRWSFMRNFYIVPTELHCIFKANSWLLNYHNKKLCSNIAYKQLDYDIIYRFFWRIMLTFLIFVNFIKFTVIGNLKQQNIPSNYFWVRRCFHFREKNILPETKICTQRNTFYKRLPNYTTLMDGSYSLYMQFVSYKFQLPMILFNGFFIFMHGLFVLDWIIPRMGLGREIELRVFYTQRVITKNVGIIIRRPFWVKKIAFSLPLGWNIKFDLDNLNWKYLDQPIKNDNLSFR